MHKHSEEDNSLIWKGYEQTKVDIQLGKKWLESAYHS